MIKDLHIQGFRRFADYRLKDLARVNLLVGDNNCGKTSLLESLYFLQRGRSGLEEIAVRRGHVVERPTGNGRADRQRYPLLTHFFHGHDFRVGSWFEVQTSGVRRKLEVTPYQVFGPAHTGVPNDFSALITGNADPDRPEYQFPVSRESAFGTTEIGTWNPDAPARRQAAAQFLYGEIEGWRFRVMWDDVNRQRREQDVVDALRIIDDRITDLHVDASLSDFQNPRVGVWFGSDQQESRLPIGVLGDGMIRLLGLGVALVFCRSGALLCDEIDTGLHWSIMGDLWKFVVEAAVHNNTQVFATTHSFDCLRGLEWACVSFPALAEHVSIQSIKGPMPEAIPLEGNRLPFIMEQQIEVR